MQDGTDISERELTRDELERLISAGLIRSDRKRELLALHGESIDWKSWAGLWSGALGAIFLLAGVIFFFAWNWKELSPFLRFTVLEGSVVLVTAGALIAGVRSSVGQWLLVAASVLTGVLVAVYGQVYQTGADAFEVFALWAALMFGWVLVSRFAPLWLFWLAVLQTALSLWGGQVLIPSNTIDRTTSYLVLGLISTGFVILREFLEPLPKFAWVRGQWIRGVLVVSALVWLSLIPWEMIFEFRWWNFEAPQLRLVGLLAWMAVVVGGAFFYTRVRPSLTSMGLCVLSASVILAMWLGREVVGESEDNAVAWLLTAFLAILIFSGAAVIIARASRVIAGGETSKRDSEGEAR